MKCNPVSRQIYQRVLHEGHACMQHSIHFFKCLVSDCTSSEVLRGSYIINVAASHSWNSVCFVTRGFCSPSFSLHPHFVSVSVSVSLSLLVSPRLSFRTRTHTRRRSALGRFQMDPRRETSGRTTLPCTSTWWSTIRPESRTLSSASKQGNWCLIKHRFTQLPPLWVCCVRLRACFAITWDCGCVCVCARACVCVFVRESDRSSETRDEWASSLGTARAIFSAGLYVAARATAVRLRSVLMTKDLREHKTNLSSPQSAGQPLSARRRAESDLCVRERNRWFDARGIV